MIECTAVITLSTSREVRIIVQIIYVRKPNLLWKTNTRVSNLYSSPPIFDVKMILVQAIFALQKQLVQNSEKEIHIHRNCTTPLQEMIARR